MPQQNKKRPRAVVPKESSQYKFRVLTRTSFTVETRQKPTKQALQKPTRSAALERVTIERIVDRHMRLSDKRAKILKWAQDAENLLAQRDQRSPRMIEASEAASTFCHHLLEDDPSALALLPRLSRPRKNSLIDYWEGEDEDAIDAQKKDWMKAWSDDEGIKLTATQREILTSLERLRPLVFTPIDRQDKAAVTNLARFWDEYGTEICHAIRNGLNHPWCLEWIMLNQIFSNRKSLHRLHRTHLELQKRLQQLISLKEMKLWKEITGLLKLKPGRSLRSIHLSLQRKKLYKKPWSTFQEWISDPVRREMIDPTP